MPSTSTSTRRQQAAEQFVSITKASRDNAQAFLRNNNYDVEAAVNQYYTETQSNDVSKDKTAATKVQLNQMFDELIPKSDYGNDPSAVDAIDAESCQAYVERLSANPLSYDLFVVLHIVQAETLGQITRSGFVDGWARVMTENKERIPKETTQAKNEKEERERLWSLQEQFVRYRIKQALTDPSYFKSLYDLAFQIGREPPQKALNMMLAVAFWEALYDPTTHPWRSANVNWLESWTSFLKERFGVTGVNEDGEVEVVDYKRTVSKDLWTQLRLFAAKTMEDDTLGFWSEEQAWPGLIDEFVVWCREKSIVKAQNGEAMEVQE